MANQFEDFQKLAKDNMDVVTKSFGGTSKSVQAIATEVADYSKKAFEQTSAVAEKLAGAKTLDKAVEIQTDSPRARRRLCRLRLQARRALHEPRQGDGEAVRRHVCEGPGRRGQVSFPGRRRAAAARR